jgi:hypothetical protein
MIDEASGMPEALLLGSAAEILARHTLSRPAAQATLSRKGERDSSAHVLILFLSDSVCSYQILMVYQFEIRLD